MLQIALTHSHLFDSGHPGRRLRVSYCRRKNIPLADPVFNRVDGAIYKVCGVNPKNGMNWKKYAVSLVITNGIMILLGYIILRIQSIGLFNPNGIGAMEESLSFNTIISFMDQYQFAALFRRVGAVLSVADAGHHIHDVCIRRQRLRCLHRIHPLPGRQDEG